MTLVVVKQKTGTNLIKSNACAPLYAAMLCIRQIVLCMVSFVLVPNNDVEGVIIEK